MLWLIIVGLLLIYLPFRISRGFSAISRVAFVSIVGVKAVLLIVLHLAIVSSTGHPIIMDASTDARVYYDFGESFAFRHPMDITRNDIIAERGARSHLGYYVINLAAFQICPDYPMLFLRLSKLLMFHIGLGMLVNTWRMQTNEKRAFLAYLVLGLVFYQFFYYHVRNLKDDLLLAMFMMVMALAERTMGAAAVATTGRGPGLYRMLRTWAVIGVILWVISTIRFYLALAIGCGFAMHVVTGRGLKISYRVLFGTAIVGGYFFIASLPGFQTVEDRGGAASVTGALGNFYGLFKVFVSPLPWQHTQRIAAFPHTFYLFMLAPALWAFLIRIRDNLDWKVYVVMLIALVVGGKMKDYEPRKRYVMYPIFVSWIVLAGHRKKLPTAGPEPFDPDAYFAKRRNVYG